MRQVLLNAVGGFRAGDVFDPDQGQQRQIDAAKSIGGKFVDATGDAVGAAVMAAAAYARGDASAASGIMLAQLGGSGGGGDLFIFTGDGAPHSDITFGRWDELMAMTSALQAKQSRLLPRIRFAQPFTVPSANMPPAGWPSALGTWESFTPNTGAVTVTVPPGVKIDMLAGIGFGLGLACSPAVDGETLHWSGLPLGFPRIFQITGGATVQNSSPRALVLTPGDIVQTYFVFALAGATFLAPLAGPIVKGTGSDVVIASSLTGGYQGMPDGWAQSSAGSTLLLYQDSISSTFPAVLWAGPISEMFNGTDSLQLNQRHGPLAGRAALAALPGGYALKVGSTYFATDQGPNGAPLWWTGAAWVDASGAVIP